MNCLNRFCVFLLYKSAFIHMNRPRCWQTHWIRIPRVLRPADTQSPISLFTGCSPFCIYDPITYLQQWFLYRKPYMGYHRYDFLFNLWIFNIKLGNLINEVYFFIKSTTEHRSRICYVLVRWQFCSDSCYVFMFALLHIFSHLVGYNLRYWGAISKGHMNIAACGRETFAAMLKFRTDSQHIFIYFLKFKLWFVLLVVIHLLQKK